MPFQFGLLGSLEVKHDGTPIQVKAAKQRALLASLLVDANHVVLADDLISRVWGADTAENARANLHTSVKRLRDVLSGDGRPDPIVTRPDGYVIEVADGALDLRRFEALVLDAKGAEGMGEPRRAAALLDEALGLWRGTPMLDVPSEFLHREVAPALVEQRLLTVESHVAADLQLGRHHDLLIELRQLTSQHPLRERFWAQRMLALYRCGRQAEALECFRTVSALLADELGVDPGTELRELRQKLLNEDAGLRVPQGERQDARRNDLPGDVADFAGRSSELRCLLDALTLGDEPDTAVAIAAIDGMAGVGKTALAVHAAHHLTNRYPDAQVFLDLHGHTPGREPVEAAWALDILLRAVGVAGERIPVTLEERAALWRAQIADRRVLIVLDNAATTAQVRPLLPGGRGCFVLVTSRRRLTDLDAGRTMSLDVLPRADATRLFARLAGDVRAAAEPAAAARVVEACGNLPLAIRIAAGRLCSRPAWTIDYLAQRLSAGRPYLDEFSTGDRSVAVTFALSYEQLAPEHRRLFRLLGLMPGTTADAYLAAAIADIDLNDADRLLEDLVDVHLLEQPGLGRYRFHDLLRHYAVTAARDAEPEVNRREAVDRVLDYYLYVADTADRHINRAYRPIVLGLAYPPQHVPSLTDQAEALAWCEAEYANLIGAIAYAAEHGRDRHAWQLPRVLWRYFYLHHYIQDWIAALRLARAAADRLGDDAARAETLKAIGIASWRLGRHVEAAAYLQEALANFHTAIDAWGEADTLNYLGYVFERLGRYDEAIDHTRRALVYFRGARDQGGEASALNNLGVIAKRQGRHVEAAGYYRRSIVYFQEIDDQWGEAGALNNLAVLGDQQGRHHEAVGHYRRALAYFHKVGNAWNEARILNNLGNASRNLGEYQQAVGYHQRALALMTDIGDRDGEADVLNDLGGTCLAADQPEQARAHYGAALALADQTRNRYFQARAHEGIARTRESESPEAARRHWKRALQIYEELGVPEVQTVRDRLGQPAGADCTRS